MSGLLRSASTFAHTSWRSASFRSLESSLPRRAQSTSLPPKASQYAAKKTPMLTPTIVVIGFIPILCFALGTWQVERLKWKVNLIDELEEKLQRDPSTLPSHINLAAVPEFVFRKVYLKGTWDHEHSMLLKPRTHDGTHGYHVITPLVRSNGSTVLVDRGFISQEFAENWSKESGEVELLGMLRTAQKRNNFTPDNHPEKNEWYWSDTDAMAEYAGGEKGNVQPVFVEEIFDGHAGDASTRMARGVPIGRPASVDIRNSHASYIATWYSLSAFTSVMFIRLLMKQRNYRARMPRVSRL
ncbi:SURF1 family-domain-containing protein [Cristinia sonorae]|uniref:SURF1-like protein n=1 Tax=Cristinia sonorae TaxID=1940300 RepID=A0A8K0XNQ7_9AGAR|nr:SURF1 family-domain-containing protein [Cristinia sonorae]